MERCLASWLESELWRFHVVASRLRLVLAASILAIELAVHPQDRDRLVLSAALLSACIVKGVT